MSNISPDRSVFTGARADPAPKGSDARRSSAGWQSWPIIASGNWGLVFVSTLGRFGYYEDEEDEDEALVYFGAPLSGDGPFMYPRSALRQPPFDGECVSMGARPAAELFAAYQSTPATFSVRMPTMPRARGDSKRISLDMFKSGQTIPQIAAARSLTISTIEQHLVDTYQEGLCPEAPQLLGLTPSIRNEIRSINANLVGEDVGRLRPIKDRCAHSYVLIKLALIA
jgi:hypothetical protein